MNKKATIREILLGRDKKKKERKKRCDTSIPTDPNNVLIARVGLEDKTVFKRPSNDFLESLEIDAITYWR
jgi:hypothetical protein